MNKWFWILLAFVLVVGLTVGFLVKSSKVERVIVIDTLVQERIRTELSRDTVIKWYEKVVWKNVTPEKEVTQTADTVFVETVKYLDLMLKVDKKGDKITIFAYNENNKLVKEFTFDGVGDNFTATSQTGNIFVKSKKVDWNGVDLVTSSSIKKTSEGTTYFKDWDFGIKSGVNFYNRVDLNAYWLYSQKDIQIKAELSYKIVP